MHDIHDFFRAAFTYILVLFVFAASINSHPVKSATSNIIASDKKDQRQIDFADSFMGILRYEDSESMRIVKDNWHLGLLPMALEVLLYGRAKHHKVILNELIQNELNTPEGFSTREWYNILWNMADFEADPGYHTFKASIYSGIDERFVGYFQGGEQQTRIRLDEVQWGGVAQDGISSLRNPEMISAEEAGYLEDNNIVFGI